MSGGRAMCLQRALTTVCIWSGLTLLLSAAPMPKNFVDRSNQVVELFRDGASLHDLVGFQLPDTSLDSNGDLRRKRSLDESALTAETGPRTSFAQLMRNLNAPCHAGGMGGGGTPSTDDGEDIVEEARRRIARMKARKAAAGKKAKNAKSKSKSKTRRRRRQTEIDDLEGSEGNEGKEFEKEFVAHMQHFAENMNRVYEHIAASVMDAMKRMEEQFGKNGEQS